MHKEHKRKKTEKIMKTKTKPKQTKTSALRRAVQLIGFWVN